MTIPPWLATAFVVITPFVFWVGNILLKRWLERTVEAQFDKRMEVIRSDLRVKEAKISALQSAALSNRAGRDTIIEKRKIEALESIWRAALLYREFKMALTTFNVLKIEEMSQMHEIPEAMCQAIRTLSGVSDERLRKIGNIGGDIERVFLPIDVWASYAALRSITIFAVAKLNMLAIGVRESHKLIDSAYVLKIAKEVLPSHEQFIDEHGMSIIGYLADPIEQLLLSQIQNALRGEDTDQASVERSANVLRLVNQMEVEVARATA